MTKEKLVLGKVQRAMEHHGFTFLAPLDMDVKEIRRNQVVAVESADKGTIIAKITSRKKAEDDYFCECKNLFFIDEDGWMVDELSYPLTQSPVYRVERIDFACETI
jgi:hypothetical protein